MSKLPYNNSDLLKNEHPLFERELLEEDIVNAGGDYTYRKSNEEDRQIYEKKDDRYHDEF